MALLSNFFTYLLTYLLICKAIHHCLLMVSSNNISIYFHFYSANCKWLSVTLRSRCVSWLYRPSTLSDSCANKELAESVWGLIRPMCSRHMTRSTAKMSTLAATLLVILNDRDETITQILDYKKEYIRYILVFEYSAHHYRIFST